MRRAARTDDNHSEVMEALKKAAMKPLSLASMGKGCPDILVGFRGINLLLEVKDGAKKPSERVLTADERNFFATWPGHAEVVESPEDAVIAVTRHAQRMGVL